MSIENSLERIAAALEKIAAGQSANVETAAPKKVEAPAKAEVPKKAEAPAKAEAPKAPAKAAPAKSGVSKEQMTAAVYEVKDKFGMPEAKAILAAHGYSALGGVEAKDYKAIYEAAKQKMLADVAEEELASEDL